MKAYLDDPQLKEDFVEEIERHRKADQIVQRTYGEGSGDNWKGCAVGCAIHSLNRLKGKRYQTNNHSVYETELGIPQTLAYLEDRIFEGLSAEESKLWPTRFANAITPGADLSLVIPKFMVWLMKEQEQYVKGFPDALASLRLVAKLYRRIVRGGTVTNDEWDNAESAAWSAAWSARSAAWSARSAARSAESAARSAESAAWSAAWSARSAAWSAESAAYTRMADKLISLLEKSVV